MKKTLLALLLVVVMAISVVALVACDKEVTYTGEYHYNAYSTEYGAKVDVVVKGDKIVSVKLYTEAESGYVRTSAGWESKATAEDGYAALVAKFAGKTVAEINAITVTYPEGGGAPSAVPTEFNIAGATQSAGRVVLAVQNALSKIGK